MKAVWIGASACALLCVGPVNAESADKQPNRGPVPGWVKRPQIPDPDPARTEAPLQILLLDSQTKLGVDTEETYFEMVMKPQTVGGLQGLSTITLPWNVSRADLTVHAIEALRDGKSIDLIGGKPFTILRRESKLEASQIDGVRSIVLPVRGLEIGDTVRISASYLAVPSKLTSRAEDLSKWQPPFPVVLLDRRVIIPTGTPIKWRAGDKVPKPTVTVTPTQTEYYFSEKKAEPRKFPSSLPVQEQANDIQFTAYQDWSDVVAGHVDLYTAARKTAAGSPLSLEADKIGASTTDPAKRMMLALRLVQDRVRYIAMLLGDGAYNPTTADESWDARYGDCKAKSALLLALLDKLGIPAEPMYVHSSAGGTIEKRLPSLATFDHVIVKATIGGKSYYLDGADYGHRVASDVAAAEFGYGLPIVSGAKLEAIPAYVATTPTIDTLVEWDGTKGLAGPVPFKAKLTLRGPLAIAARLKKAVAEKENEFNEFIKNYVKGIPNEKIEVASQSDDPATGDYSFEFKGSYEMDWDEYEDRKGMRFPFNNDASNWNADFDRKEGAFKDAPVLLNPAYWQRQTETVLLPSAKGFKIDDAEPIDRTIAGTRIWRSVTMEGTRVTSVSNFRHVTPTIPAADARAAEGEIKQISENWAYLVGPKSLRTPKGK
jgi:transglutaminase-like putative cysteine protease